MLLKNYITLLIFVFATTFVNAQKNKNVILASVTYAVKHTKNNQLVVDDSCILDIGKTQSFFYSKNLADNATKMTEAFEKAKVTGIKPNFNASDFVLAKLYRNYKVHSFNDKQTVNIQNINNQMLGYVDSDFTNNWKILADTVTINGFKCQKAELNRSTGLITSWFCKDIPFQVGPFSFFGLPGLIVKTSSTDGWESELKGIIYNKDEKKS